jgi:hypothetical protein
VTTRALLADFRLRVVRPTLQHLDGLVPYSLAAENLLVGTAAHESGLAALAQRGGGPALGVFQVEPATHQDLRDNFLRQRPELALRVDELAAPRPSLVAQLVTNLAYASAIARLVYFRAPEKMPAAEDEEGLALLWKRRFNTPAGKGTGAQFLYHYRALVGAGDDAAA